MTDWSLLNADAWLERLDNAEFRGYLARACGYTQADWEPRARLWRNAFETFLHRFGPRPVVLCRCPGRVNLRGMHVDTHGGFVNVMTHQRETVVVASPAREDTCTVTNCDPAFTEFAFLPEDEPAPPDPSGWERFLHINTVEAHLHPFRGTWGMYVVGCAQSLRARIQRPVPGFDAVVASDLPRGAALSASHALCVATMLACESIAGVTFSPRERILAARDAEWYAGARTGTSDQSAMILGTAGTMLWGPLPPSDLDLSRVYPIAWPGELSLVVAQSFTSRSLSGADRIAYSANRFAYSLALEILRKALGAHEGSLRHLCEITEERYDTVRLLDAVMRIPERLSMDVLRAECDAQLFEQSYERYFGDESDADTPHEIPLRGPLLFGIAESERARRFGKYIECGQYRQAGALMTIGHNGDRRVDSNGRVFRSDVDDAALTALEHSGEPLCMIPGVYGASSPALDALVDAALKSGAYGASLTGAGIAGVVLALCAKDDAEHVMAGLRTVISSAAYAKRAGFENPLSADQAQSGVVLNFAPVGAGIVRSSG